MTDAASLVGGANDPSEVRSRCSADLLHETERAALIKEYDFVSSLIPMYRRLEIQAVQLSLIIVVAATGFIGEALTNNELAASFAAAALPLLLSFILLAICGMEVRIIRASRFLDRSIGQRLKELTGREVLKWERSPGLHLDRLQRRFQSSWTYILIIVVPGLLGASGAIWGALFVLKEEDQGARPWLLLLTALGLVLLLTWGIAAARISGRHEGRGLSLKGLWTRSLRVLPGIPASDVTHAKDCARVDLVVETPTGEKRPIYRCVTCGARVDLPRALREKWIGVHEDTSNELKAISLGVADGANQQVLSSCEVVAPFGQLSTNKRDGEAALSSGKKLLYPAPDFVNAPQRPLDDGTYRVRWFSETDIGRRLAVEDAFEIRDGRVAW